MVLYLRFLYGSQFSEDKNDLKTKYGYQDIKHTRSLIFFGTPCIVSKSLVNISTVTAEILLIWTNVAMTFVGWTNVTVTVGICLRWSKEPAFKV